MMKLNLPKTIKDCTPDQLSKWLLITDSIKDNDNTTDLLIFQCQLLSIFSGESLSSIKKADLYNVQEASTYLLSVLSAYNYAEPKEVIQIEGKSYFYRKDFSHISTGQIIDLKLIEDISNDPTAVLAIMYVEDGMEYCQEDDRGRVLNPTSKRYDIFKSHFPGDEFLNFFTFFFSLLRKAESGYYSNSDSESTDADDDNDSGPQDSEWYTWTTILHRLSKEMGCSVERITEQPYVKTLFWLNYIKLTDEKQTRLHNR